MTLTAQRCDWHHPVGRSAGRSVGRSGTGCSIPPADAVNIEPADCALHALLVCRPCPVRLSPAQPLPAQPGPARPSPTLPGPPRSSPPRPGSPGPVRRGPRSYLCCDVTTGLVSRPRLCGAGRQNFQVLVAPVGLTSE